MTVESSVYVRIPEAATRHIVELDARAKASLRRSAKLPPGDRTEVIRFEALHAAIDQLAVAAMANGEPHLESAHPTVDSSGRLNDSKSLVGPSVLLPGAEFPFELPDGVLRWLREGNLVVELRLPHAPGETMLGGEAGRGPPKPASRWRNATETPRDAVRERFEYLISQALDDSGNEEASILPSGVTNPVLTEALRRNAHAEAGVRRIDLPVRYRDGSRGLEFPLRALTLTRRVPEHWRQLRFTLMSIRHVDMDAIVDGAWLRNARVSQRRQAGHTDQVAFETSSRQLCSLDPNIPTVISMYQTGLQPAIVGFYRAVVYHLIKYPKSIVVVPYYFQGGMQFDRGTAWTTM